MWTQDFVRVLQGASKVAEQVVRTQGPDVATKSGQLSKHATELARLVPYFLNGEGAPPAPASQPVQVQPAAASKPVQTQPTVASEAVQTQTETQEKAPVLKQQVDTIRETPKNPEMKITTEPLKDDTIKLPDLEDKTSEPLKIDTPPVVDEEPPKKVWEEKHVPSSPLSRILGFGGLAARLAVGTAAEIVRSGGKNGTYNALVSDANAEKLAETLCTMRGAALKLGQMLSIQDEAMIPSKLAVALDRVRENAHVMPKDQLHHQLKTELGDDWRDNVQEFDDVPIAAASIGQVHRATLLNGDRVAIKIQYPGVAESIGSDLLNLKRLVTYTNILPRGLYIDEIIRVGKEELTAECDYLTEADNQERFKELIEQSGMGEKYVVPRVYRELSTARILTTQLISGVAVDKAVHLSQDVRDSIARRILELTIHELFNWRFMQTDPNWSNFMYNASTDTIGLVDFGAAREYPKAFVDDYFNIVWAAANEDEKTLVDYSIKMHFLTGDESPSMMRAHVAAGMVVGEPFRSHEPFDFQKSQLTTRLGQHTEVFMHGRLTPPPQEVYSLHRKLAGAFLMCIKLRAVVPCRDVLEDVQRQYYS
ncbi:Atypical/ABC1/ABC1-A protein kinase [Phytophthora nicotianae CJ01A1]|uniref:Atypical/ABC1/ABC1-A protein kinase n=2 Tax=Phytophthora nicotianae TaxID=4792 RepID=W2WZI4_PHYNI|nr:Atypical/ABC1/ABC1-A protein kinase [Phytophthora nicotianae]ETP15014.1 Atypical/ABC1/ABC1-A protein kinase [Phytophthora nicotianae CJ01A1]